MRVYIGPYVDRWVSYVHDHYMRDKYGYNDWPKTQTNFERFLERLEDVLQWIYNHTVNLYLDRKERKVRVRIDRYDTWNMDDTLAHIILPMLVQLKTTKHGAPWVEMEDVPKELRATKAQMAKAEKNHDVDDKHFKRWNWVLDEMIWAFEQKCRDDWEEDYTTGEYDLQWQKDEETGYSQMVEGPNHTAVTDWDGRKAHQARMSNGFRLFGKYYENLWD